MFIAKILLLCAVSALASAKPQGFFGFFQELVDVQQELQAFLEKLAAGDGPHYRISKILSASMQMVAGWKNIFTVELIDENGATKVCEVDIWSRYWQLDAIHCGLDYLL